MKIKIEKLTSKGQGFGIFKNKRYYFDNVLPDEIIEIDDANQAHSPIQIHNKNPNRQSPPCKYFNNCGGCSIQHLAPEYYADFKFLPIQKSINDIYPDSSDKIEPLWIANEETRRKCRFKTQMIDNDLFFGFLKNKTNKITNIDYCLLLDKEINNAIESIKKIIVHFNPLIISYSPLNIEIIKAENGLDVIFYSEYLIGHNEKKLIKTLEENFIRATWHHNGIITEIYNNDDPIIMLGDEKASFSAGCFMQPTKPSQNYMIDFVIDKVQPLDQVVEFFAGIGTFTIPISKITQICAYEINENFLSNLKNKANIQAISKNLFTTPLKPKQLDKFNIAVINPPRAGSAKQITNIAKSNIKKVIMIYCDLKSFIADLKILKEHHFNLITIAPIDQFLYSHHIEILAYLERE